MPDMIKVLFLAFYPEMLRFLLMILPSNRLKVLRNHHIVSALRSSHFTISPIKSCISFDQYILWSITSKSYCFICSDFEFSLSVIVDRNDFDEDRFIVHYGLACDIVSFSCCRMRRRKCGRAIPDTYI